MLALHWYKQWNHGLLGHEVPVAHFQSLSSFQGSDQAPLNAPLYQSWVIAAVQGNNEVSMWDMETGDRRFTLWASSAPPLSELQPSPHSVHGIYCSPADGNPILLTAGSDMKIRFWDLAYPERSYVVAGGSSSPSVSYYRKIIEGTEVVQEIQNKQKVGPSDDALEEGQSLCRWDITTSSRMLPRSRQHRASSSLPPEMGL